MLPFHAKSSSKSEKIGFFLLAYLPLKILIYLLISRQISSGKSSSATNSRTFYLINVLYKLNDTYFMLISYQFFSNLIKSPDENCTFCHWFNLWATYSYSLLEPTYNRLDWIFQLRVTVTSWAIGKLDLL